MINQRIDVLKFFKTKIEEVKNEIDIAFEKRNKITNSYFYRFFGIGKSKLSSIDLDLEDLHWVLLDYGKTKKELEDLAMENLIK